MSRGDFMGERESPVHLVELQASDEDVDGLDHISNVAYVRWVQDAAGSHSEAVGWDLERYKELGSVFVVRSHEITYLRPTFAGDEIEIRTWIESWRGASSPRKTQIFRKSDGEELARAITRWALISASSGRPLRIPPEMRTDFGKDPGPPRRLER